MISTETMEQIIIDYMTGRKQRNISPEAKAFLSAFKEEEAMAREKGWSIEIPFEVYNSNYETPEADKPKANRLTHMISILRTHGGAGSGNYGHKGRPGRVGGSQPRGESAASGAPDIAGDYSKWDFESFKQRGAEMVPLEFLGKALEFNRMLNPLTSNIDELAQDIAENGLEDSFILDWSAVDNRVKVGEGNHRFWALKKLGFSHAPARVVTSKRYPNEKGPTVPGVKPDWSGYIPSTPSPTQIGIPGVIPIEDFMKMVK